MTIHRAIKAFDDNAQNYVSAEGDPYKWNINSGLLNLCHAVRDIESKLAELDRKIAHVSQQIAYTK